ncbi:putative uncharacterized protein [Bacteroides sp. CAG:598]|nr:putative uncharacterized protein [Bacteroides sp. CAG:598]
MFFLNFKRKPENIFYNSLSTHSNIYRMNLFSLAVQRYLPVRLRSVKQNFIFHSTYYRYSTNPQAINITTVHDFTYEFFSSGLKKIIHCWQKYRAIRNSQYIICISHNTKNDLLKFLPDIPVDKIRVVYNGVSEDYRPIPNWKGESLPFKKNDYLLFVGARGSYKNFEFLVKSLKGTNYNLLIVGPDLLSDEISLLNINLGKHYYYMGRLSNEELNKLYNGAYAFVYPSSYEGFGIPVLEAQKAGCPVIAYNSSSIPEIIGDTPLLMNTLSDKELLEKLSLLSDYTIRERIIEEGFRNVKRFSWDRTFRETIEIYKEAEEAINLMRK